VSAAPVHRLPYRHRRGHRWGRRILGVLATVALLGIPAWTALQVLSPGDDVLQTASVGGEPAAAATPEPAAAGEAPAKRSKPALTRAQRRQRAAAAAVLRDQGYRPQRLAAYDPSHTLRVLIGRRDGGQRAFFFVRGRYIGTDATTDSSRMRLLGTGERSVTVSYRLFARGDQSCCPTGGSVRVRFRWDGKALSPDNAIPPASSRRAPL
jgi:hypothetical protein